MKNIFFYIVLFCFSLESCNNWLDVPSKTEVIDYDMFKTEQGFMDVMSGVYYLMVRNELYGDMLTLTFLDMQARRFDLSNSYTVGTLGKNIGDAGYYEESTVNSVINNIWKKGYNVIANINSLLEQIDKYQSVFTYDNYRLIKGEALGLRAFIHFDLMRMFGKSYSETGNELAIPYVTELSGRKWPLFFTQDSVMIFALADLKAAENLLEVDDLSTSSLENSWINSRRSHFNLWAVYATMARIYHWKGDTENALLYAKKVIESQQFEFFTPPTGVSPSGSRDVAFYSECIFSLYKDDLNDLYLDRMGWDIQKTLHNQESDIEAVYETGAGGGTDYRFTWLWSRQVTTTSSKYNYYRYYTTIAEIPNLVTLLRWSEMYYIAAECSGNTESGRAYLNEVRVNRGLTKLVEDITDDTFEEVK